MMPSYPMHDLSETERSLAQAVLDHKACLISDEVYQLLRKKLRERVAKQKRDLLSGAAKLKIITR